MRSALYRLDSEADSQVWACPGHGMPVLIYWGDPLPPDEDLNELMFAWQPGLPHGGLDQFEWPSWLPEAGRGFSGTPGIELQRGGLRCLTQCQLKAVHAETGTLTFELSDDLSGVVVHLHIRALAGGWSAWVKLTNCGTTALEVEQLASLCMPLPIGAAERWSVGGVWAGEFQARREPLAGLSSWQVSRTGRPGHQSHPSCTWMESGTCSDSGQVWSAQLAWSGNHRIGIEPQRLHGTLVWLGELLLPGEVCLMPGASHQTATVHLRRSGGGTRGMALGWHRQVRFLQATLPAERRRRVQFNTWEAIWFEHDSQALMELATAAAQIGVERFVLDDGWFAGRRHDRSGLGDWWPCPDRYPQGLGPLAAHCQSLGMQFGLWVEPEGVNADSALFRAHPDWVLQDAGRIQPLGRQQYVLDLGRPEVADHLFVVLSDLLRRAPIDYLKWDMNRDFTHEHGSDGRPGVRAHVLGLYALLARLRRTFPDVEIEACASGGARADLGVLQLQHRVWVSDCHDPLERQRMQSAFMQLLPPELMGSHLGPERSHHTGRAASLGLRSLNALFGSLGLEFDLRSLSTEEAHSLRCYLAAYKALRDEFLDCDISTIDTPDGRLTATWAVRRDGRAAWLSLVQHERCAQAGTSSLPLPGLPPERRFQITAHPLWPAPCRPSKEGTWLDQGRGLRLSGSALAKAGLRLPLLWPGDGCLLQLEAL
jgi:alpha-galactosidase